MNLSWRFSKERLIDSCLTAGLMEILWDLLPKTYIGSLPAGDLLIVANSKTLRIDNGHNQRIYIAQRDYNASDIEEFLRARSEIIILPSINSS